jgi:hypothetical protein
MRVYKFLDAKYGLKTLLQKRVKISTVDDLNDPFELEAYEITERKERTGWRKARKILGSQRGLMCFSADWRDPVIWAHYSDKHKGLCLCFEIPDNSGRKVQYVNARLKLSDALAVENADAWLYTKYENWAYEREIRCWTTLDTPSQGLYFMEFGPSLKLVEVIAGARCMLTKGIILEAVKPLNDIKLIKARAGFHRFEVVEDQRGFLDRRKSGF